jgi:hypothetical protein
MAKTPYRVAAADTNAYTEPSILERVIVIAPGSAGSVSIWNGDAVGDEAAANLRWTRAFGDMKAGDVYELGVPCDDGVRCDITTGGIFILVLGT